MAFTAPTHVPSEFDFWDNEKIDWLRLFRDVGRKPQRSVNPVAILVENAPGTELLRRYADLVSHTAVNARSAIQNLTEFKLGGVINVALDQSRLLGLVWNYRPIVPSEHMEAYQAVWRKHAYIPSKDDLAGYLNDLAFLAEVVPLLGKWSLELPRGYGSPTQTSEQTGASEAEEELLVRCLDVQLLGRLGEDTAQNPALNAYNVAWMDVKGKPSTPRDLWEKIVAKGNWGSHGEVDQAVRDGHIVDPFTLAGLQMLRIYRPDVYESIPL